MPQLTLPARDGTEIQAYDDGTGPVVLLVHGGMDDGRGYRRVAEALADRFRVLRIVRRRYRLDLPADPTVKEEAADMVALARSAGEPVVYSATPRARSSRSRHCSSTRTRSGALCSTNRPW